jgi:hypothetical protein
MAIRGRASSAGQAAPEQAAPEYFDAKLWEFIASAAAGTAAERGPLDSGFAYRLAGMWAAGEAVRYQLEEGIGPDEALEKVAAYILTQRDLYGSLAASDTGPGAATP